MTVILSIVGLNVTTPVNCQVSAMLRNRTHHCLGFHQLQFEALGFFQSGEQFSKALQPLDGTLSIPHRLFPSLYSIYLLPLLRS
jgi:hypothetical protein